MKPIELTEEQKEKLLKMCKELFPKYKFIKFTKDHEMIEGGEDNNILLFYTGGNDSVCIHWFEFCMTHLSDAIAKKKYYPADLIDMIELGKKIITNRYGKHIVDYLYEQFKKLK